MDKRQDDELERAADYRPGKHKDVKWDRIDSRWMLYIALGLVLYVIAAIWFPELRAPVTR